jgi:hypothetical protein
VANNEVGLYNVRFDHERNRALENARTRRAEAQVLATAGDHRAADVLLAAAHVCEDSAEYWDEEIRILQAKMGRRGGL